MEFGMPGYDDLVWDVSLVCDRIRSSTHHGLNGKMQLGDYLNARAGIKINQYRRDYTAKNIAFASAILSIAGKIHPEFLRLLWVLTVIQNVKYYNLVGDEEDIGNEQFKWSQASTFSYDRNAIGLAVARARGGGGLQPDVATRPLERTRGMRTCTGECIPINAEALHRRASTGADQRYEDLY